MTSDEREFARAGPAFGDVERLGPIDWTAWSAAAARLSAELAGAADLPRRIHHLYVPVLFFCAAQARLTRGRPCLIGIQAPQGAGKTTLVRYLLDLLPSLGLRGAGVSIDDFYLTRDEQLRLAAAHPGNPYLEHRGYPGTHDIGLGEATLAALRGLAGSDSAAAAGARVPVYDKSAHGGRGDRAPATAWRDVTGPLDIVFVEGWMLGFSPLPEAALADPALVAPNRALASYDRWHRLLDAFVVLRATDPRFVLRWRVEAEEAMRASGRPALDRAAIEDYIRRFLPAYATYGGAPPHIPPDRQITVWLDEQRRVTKEKPFVTGSAGSKPPGRQS
jgi:D-glycerate 3-kinase